MIAVIGFNSTEFVWKIVMEMRVQVSKHVNLVLNFLFRSFFSFGILNISIEPQAISHVVFRETEMYSGNLAHTQTEWVRCENGI